jgi:hypothetical protein
MEEGEGQRGGGAGLVVSTKHRTVADGHGQAACAV